MFRALINYNYRLFFIGQTLSLIGSWMDTVAMSWLVYRLTGSELLLGTVAFCSQIPMFMVSPFAGVFADRLDRRRLLVITQSASGVQAGLLAVLVLTGMVQVWHIIVLAVVAGVVSAFDMPGRQAFVPELVERELLANVIALNSSQFNIARLIGPAFAGWTIALVGEGWCFALNSASFLAVIVALVLMRLPRFVRKNEYPKLIDQLVEGAKYCWRSHPIRSLLLLMAIMGLVSGAYSVLLPVYAKEVFHGDSKTLGYLYAAVGLGALGGALLLATRKTVVGLGAWILRSASAFAIFVGVLGLAHSIWLGVACLVVVGLGAMLHMGSTNTLIQTIADQDIRGRVMAFYAMSFVGTMPIGSLLAGATAARFGPMDTLLGACVVGLMAAFGFYRSLPEIRRVLRPIYEEMGILTPAAGS